MKFFTATLVSLFFVLPAHALIEAKLTYGMLAANPDLTQVYSGAASTPSVTPTYGLGGDLVIGLPMVPVGFGLRYESMALKLGSSGVDFNIESTRTALVLNYRLIDTILHVGPIFTYGLSHSTKLSVEENGTKRSDFSSDSPTSWSAGVEVGVQIISFIVGAEVGYEDFRWKKAHDKTGNFSDRDINMSGTYGKVMIGLGI